MQGNHQDKKGGPKTTGNIYLTLHPACLPSRPLLWSTHHLFLLLPAPVTASAVPLGCKLPALDLFFPYINKHVFPLRAHEDTQCSAYFSAPSAFPRQPQTPAASCPGSQRAKQSETPKNGRASGKPMNWTREVKDNSQKTNCILHSLPFKKKWKCSHAYSQS